MVSPLLTPFINRFSIAAWNSTIRQAMSQGDARGALLLFRQLKQQSAPRPTNFTYPFVAKACAMLSELRFSGMVHSNAVAYSSDMNVQTALVDAYVKCGSLDCAHRLFDEMSKRDAASWNVIIVGLAQWGSLHRASLLINRMANDGVVPDAVTVMGLTQLVSGMKDGRLLCAVHCFGMKCGFGGHEWVANTWISGYAKCGDLCSAEMVISSISVEALSVGSWNAMISGCSCVEDSGKAIEFYQQMVRSGYRPDLSTFLNLLVSFDQPKFLYYGMLIHAHAVKFGYNVHIALLNTLISMYSKGGDINSARSIFDCMSERSCVSWIVMMGGYSERGDLDEALSLFHDMEAAGEEPNMVMIIHLIAACGKVGALEVGKWIDDYALSTGLKNNVTVCNALLNMYVKCGSLEDAQKLFRIMNGTNEVSWTTLIQGFALNGQFQAALDYFNQMLRLGLKPNHITFLAVLQACTHAGFLEKGWEIFHMMTSMYSISPGLEHYACMTDLLGRQGKLKEALEFIQEMPMKPDAGIWGALLSACKIHRNIEIGERAAHHLLQLEPHAAAPYIEVANIYASKRDWNGVAATRMKMKSKQVTKSPGQSVIHVLGRCRSFRSEDRFHSEGFEIFEIADSLTLQLKDKLDQFALEEIVSLFKGKKF